MAVSGMEIAANVAMMMNTSVRTPTMSRAI